ncbi:hypothetical protein B0T22DRAFT_461324 [Podospora appendiculata]|uniref:FAD-binding domain-containing protein n=1 Tax=Podospora appendiculata TaxID=314037 RepID=A0AAE0XBD1_9PEZI|nr:hypothetical protein B0T22DRAFT_461324 [Podospora appendiculata]
MAENPANPILIIGAGLTGLLLAQHLCKSGIPFQIFERDADYTSRGVGWGLTLHWCLPALRSLLPEDLVRRLPETYVDRAAVADGKPSTFPFYNLSTGELKLAAPAMPEALRIRVSRERFRRLLATGIDIQWNKAASTFDSGDDSITVGFDDGSSATGSLLVACDGGNSRVRRFLFPQHEKFEIPLRLMGMKVEYTPEQLAPMQKLDPIFLQGSASENDTYVFFSMLDAPDSTPDSPGKYICQIGASWPVRAGFFGQPEPIEVPATNEGRIKLFKTFAATWAEPFRSLAGAVTETTDVKGMQVYDWPPPKGLRGTDRIALVGDALHPMAMYRGEGANHAIVDVLDLVERVITPHLASHQSTASNETLRAALDGYEDEVVSRSRPGVLASRQACLDAHRWSRIDAKSPLVSRRVMKLGFEEGDLVY